jgi:hypothetical protein
MNNLCCICGPAFDKVKLYMLQLFKWRISIFRSKNILFGTVPYGTGVINMYTVRDY